MTYRKTWFSYVLWVIYAGLCVAMLAFTGFGLWQEYISPGSAEVGVVLIFPLAAKLYTALRAVSRKIREKWTVQPHTIAMWEAFAAAFAFVFGTLYRLHTVLYAPASEIVAAGVSGVDYYDLALVRAGEGIEPMVHGVGYLYVFCLSLVLSFLGNKILSAMFFQAFLQVLSLILCYAVVKKAAGRLPACASLFYLAFARAYVGRVTVIDPECFYFLLYLAGMYLIVRFLKEYCSGLYGKVFSLWVAAVTGILLGILVYLDIRSVTLLCLLAGIFTGKKEEDEELPQITAGQNVLVFLAAAVFCAAGFFGAFWVDSFGYGTAYMAEFSAWTALYQTGWQGGFLTGMESFMLDFPVNGLLILAASFLALAFPKSGKEQNYMLWILLCVCTAPTPVTGYGLLPYSVIALFVWSVLAGLGLQNCLLGDKDKVLQAKIEKINAAVGVEDMTDGAGGGSAIAGVKDMDMEDEWDSIGRLDDAEAGGPADRETGGLADDKPRYLENPLPLPKKHVKREMDYDYPVAEQDMHYDVEVDERDDFDI